MRKFIPGGPPRYAHQRLGLNKMIRTGGVTALLMEPGCGKTATTLDYLSILALKREDEVRVLVVAPLAAVDTWVTQTRLWLAPDVSYWVEVIGGSLIQRAETMAARGGDPFSTRFMRRITGKQRRPQPMTAPRALNRHLSWAHDMRRCDGAPCSMNQGPDGLGDGPRLVLLVSNFDTFSSRATVGSGTMADLMVDAVKRYNPEVVVVDESHKIKSAGSNVSRLMGRIGQQVQRRIILTGTVMPAGPLDIYGQWRFLDPYAFGWTEPDGERKKATMSSFTEMFAIKGGYMGKEVKGYKNLDRMQQIMARNAVVVRKADALDLPPTTEVVVPVHLNEREKAAYAQMRKALATQLADDSTTSTSSTPAFSSPTSATVTAGNRLTQMMRLRQITSGHLPDDAGHMHMLGDSKVRTIASIVNDTLIGEKRIVVFCLFTHEIAALEKALKINGTEIMTITGATPSDERMEIRRRFGTAPDSGDEPGRMVLVAQVKTVSLAVNELITANHAVFGSLSQQRDDLVQARDRLDRIGQTRPVTFWYALAPGTIDDVILQSHRDRTDLEEAVLEHILGTDAFTPRVKG